MRKCRGIIYRVEAPEAIASRYEGRTEPDQYYRPTDEEQQVLDALPL